MTHTALLQRLKLSRLSWRTAVLSALAATSCATEMERFEAETVRPVISLPLDAGMALASDLSVRTLPWREPFDNADFEVTDGNRLRDWAFTPRGSKERQKDLKPTRTGLVARMGVADAGLSSASWNAPEIGGDYWNTPVTVRSGSIGQTGNFWLEPGAGRLESPAFTIDSSETDLTFLVRHVTDVMSATLIDRATHETLSIDLESIDADSPGMRTASQMQAVQFDLRPLREWLKGRQVQLAFNLGSGDGVDSFLLWKERPSSGELLGPSAETTLEREWGMVDLHAHLLNQIGFSGRMISGSIHSSIGPHGVIQGRENSPSDIEQALPACHLDHGTDGSGLRTSDVLPESAHPAGGFPDFDGWPHYWTLEHQQAYVEWLKRAWQGGLRIVNVDMGNSEMLSALFGTTSASAHAAGALNPTDDGWAVDAQLRAVHDFVKLPDVRSWVQIASTSGEARRIVRSGKLALILGVEVDDIGNLSDILKTMAPEEQRGLIGRYLDWLVRHDVRHVFPVHMIENALGAPAAYDFLFDMNNYLGTNQELFPLRDAFFDSGIRFRMDVSAAQLFEQNHVGFVYGLAAPLLKLSQRRHDVPGKLLSSQPNREARIGSAHRNGLTNAGKAFIEEAMRRGFIIDLDHMSERAAGDTLDLVEPRNYPVLSSHTGFRDLAFGSWKRVDHEWVRNWDTQLEADPHLNESLGASGADLMAKERDRSARQLERIAALGGMVGIGTGAGAIPVSHPFGNSSVPQDCDGSSTVFAQEYLYAIEYMGGRGVGVGTDLNGLNGMANPRFGLIACRATSTDPIRSHETRAQVEAQRNPVRYATDERTDPALGFHKALSTVGKERLEGPPNQPRSVAFDDDEAKVWQGIARWQSGFGQEPGFSVDTNTHEQDIRNVAWGLVLGTKKVGTGSVAARPKHGANVYQRAGWDLAAGQLFLHDTSDSRLQSLEKKLARMWALWNRMTSGHSPPLTKSRAGNADFDVNIDGFAHYGMMPDFIQDVRNIGVASTDLAPLFSGAADYIEMWSRIETASKRYRDDHK